ncbi:uncharacterized protein LOC115929776 [Strongylocentrotus purpuratus]|uniref:Uncharacterized protein n=1 Tax=Strongylocentrotus purpuratus TaxID=7668 RepID=A0A7M7PU86_STRPU|nr:uncharacterized protein LOC115929776 [Strongylocentrotus purpuratus]
MFHTCEFGILSGVLPGDSRLNKRDRSQRCNECDTMSKKIISEKEIQESVVVLKDRLRIMQIMVDDCADMFQQKKIKKWKAARRQSRDAHYELDWNIIGCVLIIIFCFLFRSVIALIRGPVVLEPCIELEPIAEPVN